MHESLTAWHTAAYTYFQLTLFPSSLKRMERAIPLLVICTPSKLILRKQTMHLPIRMNPAMFIRGNRVKDYSPTIAWQGKCSAIVTRVFLIPLDLLNCNSYSLACICNIRHHAKLNCSLFCAVQFVWYHQC